MRECDELPRLVHAGNFEGEENVVSFFYFTPCGYEPETGIQMRCFVRSEDGFPAQEIRDPIATEHVHHPSLL